MFKKIHSFFFKLRSTNAPGRVMPVHSASQASYISLPQIPWKDITAKYPISVQTSLGGSSIVTLLLPPFLLLAVFLVIQTQEAVREQKSCYHSPHHDAHLHIGEQKGNSAISRRHYPHHMPNVKCLSSSVQTPRRNSKKTVAHPKPIRGPTGRKSVWSLGPP